MRKFADAPTKSKPKKTRAEVDAIIHEIVVQMSGGLWVRGQSHKEVAKKYGVMPDQARRWSATASRLVVNFSDPDEIHEIKVSAISSYERQAIQLETLAMKAGQDPHVQIAARKAVLASIEKVTEVSGAKYDSRETRARPDLDPTSNILNDPNLKLLFDTIVIALRASPNTKEAARIVVAAVEKLGGPIAKAMIGEPEVVETTGGQSDER
jgi:hypothetical protein